MANNLRHDADVLVSIASGDQLELTEALKKALHSSAVTLYKLDKLKHALEASNPEDEGATDQIAAQMVALLGLTRS